MPPPQTIKIFCSYAHKDERLREALDPHFALLRREGVATFWSDKEIYAGEDWAAQIDQNLRSANIILLLLSHYFFNSKYCYEIEMQQAVERHYGEGVELIPIILSPCDWSSVSLTYKGGVFELGQLQALPIGARPVIQWGKRVEAYHNIAQGVSKVVKRLKDGATPRDATPIKPPARADANVPPVPDLLPYLCDRATQETVLRRAIHTWSARGLAKRPLVCIVHGSDDESIDMFQRRLHEVTLPALLSARAESDSEPLYDSARGRLDDTFIQLPPDFIRPDVPFDFLQSEVGVPVADNMYASPKAVADALSSKDVPTLFHSHLASCDWDGDGKDIVEAFLDFWGSLPDVKAGRVLSFLFFKYSSGRKDTSAQLAKLNARAEKFFNGLDKRLADFPGVQAVVLPRLPAIALSDVENWVKSHEHFRSFCGNHLPEFCNVPRAVEEIEAIYTDPLMRIPMEQLAPQLYAIINNHRCAA